ncbi:unnamed protein product, partial [Tetraodon nigroviridis]
RRASAEDSERSPSLSAADAQRWPVAVHQHPGSLSVPPEPARLKPLDPCVPSPWEPCCLCPPATRRRPLRGWAGDGGPLHGRPEQQERQREEPEAPLAHQRAALEAHRAVSAKKKGSKKVQPNGNYQNTITQLNNENLKKSQSCANLSTSPRTRAPRPSA